MITVSTLVSGGQIAEGMRDDPEEMAEMLQGLASDIPDEYCEDVADWLSDRFGTKVVDFLRDLITEIESR